MNNIYMKLLLCFIIALVLYQTIRYSQSTTFHLYDKRTTNEFKISSWSCEVDRRLILELQEEIRSKDKLLKYREKVIGDLRLRYRKLNATLTELQSKYPDASSENDDSERGKRSEVEEGPIQSTSNSPKLTTPFPPDMDRRASKTSKPCCIALKRMTDILRSYMQRTSDLRDQVAVLENSNITDLLSKLTKIQGHRFKSSNCSLPAEEENINNEKDSLYITFDRRYVYQAMPVYVDTKRRIGKGHWGIHQDVEMNRAYSLAIGQLIMSKYVDGKSLTISSGLVKVDPQFGVTYVFTIRSNSTNHTYMVSVQRTLGPLGILGEMKDVSPKLSTLINIIVPISGRGDRLKQFLEMLYVVCIKENINIFLTVIIYGKNSKDIKSIIKGFSRATGFQSYDILRKDNADFARGRALHDGVLRWNGDDNVVMFFCDVDITFDLSFLQRCALYTEPGKSVYFPVVFSMYNPDIVSSLGQTMKTNKLRVNKETGVWRALGYGMVCLTRSDYLNIGGFNLEIEGWGGEDVDLYNRFVKSSLKVIRAPDPGLFHKYHPKECDPKTLGPLKYRQCLGSKARYEASQRQLGLLLFSSDNNSMPLHSIQEKRVL